MMNLKVLACTPALIDTLSVGLLLDSHPSIYCGPETHFFSHPQFWRDPEGGVSKILTLGTELKNVDSGYSWMRPSSMAVQYYLTSLSQLKSGSIFFENTENFYQWLMTPRLILEEKQVACDISEANILAADSALKSGWLNQVIVFHMNPETFIKKTRGKFPLKLSLLAWSLHHSLALNLFQKYGSERICLFDLKKINQDSERYKLKNFLNLRSGEVFSNQGLRLSTDKNIKPETAEAKSNVEQLSFEPLSAEEVYNLRTLNIHKKALASFIENPKSFSTSSLCRGFGYNKPWKISDLFKDQRKLRKPELPREHKNRVYNFFANIQS